MPQKKYGKYVISDPFKNKEKKYKDPSGVSVGYQCVTETGKAAAHTTHDFSETLCFIGGDPRNIKDFGAEITITLGDEMEEHIARKRYPKYWLLEQVNGVGVHTALSFMLTIGDPERFQTSRMVGSFLGMRPKQQESGESKPQ